LHDLRRACRLAAIASENSLFKRRRPSDVLKKCLAQSLYKISASAYNDASHATIRYYTMTFRMGFNGQQIAGVSPHQPDSRRSTLTVKVVDSRHASAAIETLFATSFGRNAPTRD